MNFQAYRGDLHERRTLKRNDVPSQICQATAWGAGFPKCTFFFLALRSTNYVTHLICGSCLWIKIVLFYSVIENDREELRWVSWMEYYFSEVVFDLIYECASVRYLHMNVYSWRASNKYICHETMLVDTAFFGMLLTITKQKK